LVEAERAYHNINLFVNTSIYNAPYISPIGPAVELLPLLLPHQIHNLHLNQALRQPTAVAANTIEKWWLLKGLLSSSLLDLTASSPTEPQLRLS